MKEVLDYIILVLDKGFKNTKFSGHDFFSNFPIEPKKYLSRETQDALYYACEFVIKNADEYNKDVYNWRYDFLRDQNLKEIPISFSENRYECFNLHNALKMVQYELLK